MRRAIISFLLSICQASLAGVILASPQQVVDRIVARIEDDIILESEVRELRQYQQLVQGHTETPDKLLNELLEQWIVENEATAAHYPRPIETEIRAHMDRLGKQFASPDAYNSRLQELGLSASSVRRIVERQIYLARYLDYKFRPAVQVDASAIATYYRQEFLLPLAARNQPAPPLDQVQDQIREVLVQRDISERVTRWLDESRSRLRIEIRSQRSVS